MNSLRKMLVGKAFNIMDKDKSGVLDINDLKGVYNAKFHPDVKSGKRSEDEILGEFLETFETHHNILKNGVRDQRVTKEEWEEYYNSISASIDSDEYFEVMMNSAWNLDGSKITKRGWAGE